MARRVSWRMASAPDQTCSPRTRTEGGASYPEKVDCKKLARKNSYAAAFADAVADYAKYIEIPQGELVVVTDGKPFVDESDSDGFLHRYQRLVAYSKKLRFAKNPCGAEKLFCEAGGSKGAQAFNRLEHALDRARVHAGSRPTTLQADTSRMPWRERSGSSSSAPTPRRPDRGSRARPTRQEGTDAGRGRVRRRVQGQGAARRRSPARRVLRRTGEDVAVTSRSRGSASAGDDPDTR